MRFFLRRAAFYLFTAWAAVTINFILPRLMKGDPVTAYLARNQGRVSPEAIESLRILFGLAFKLLDAEERALGLAPISREPHP